MNNNNFLIENLNGSQDFEDEMGDITGDQRKQMQEIEKKILSHFQEEGEMLTKCYIAEDNLENMKQNMAKSLGEVDEPTKDYMTNLESEKEKLEQECREVEKKRDGILQVNSLLLFIFFLGNSSNSER